MEEQIIEVLEKIRPYIQRDGGDVEFVSVDSEGVVTIRMHGACVDCFALDTTITEGIECILLDEVPGVTRVRLEGQQ